MNRRQLIDGLQALEPKFQEAVDLITLHIRYLLRLRGLMLPNELMHRVIGRVKSPESCFRKIRRTEKREKISFRSWKEIQGHIDDLAGVRVVCNYLQELMLVYGYLQGHPAFREMRTKFEDYVDEPKFGYRALHTVVAIRTSFGSAKCEIQIRTALQDAWAVKSHALVYKLKKTELARLPLQIRNLPANQSDMLYNMD